MNKKIIVLIALVLPIVLVSGCVNTGINSFEDCANAGYPVMESYPRQCRTPDGRTFVEVISHECTEEEKQAEACTLEYLPVCGFKSDESSQTYGNGCQACADNVNYWELGECTE
jgi:hypothetical protein